MGMESISDLLKNSFVKKLDKKSSDRSERSSLLTEIYEHYKLSTRKQNWKKYILWLRANKVKHTPQRIIEFKKQKEHIKTRSISSFCVMLAHIPTSDLYHTLSIAKDKDNRNENFSGWLLGEIYKK